MVDVGKPNEDLDRILAGQEASRKEMERRRELREKARPVRYDLKETEAESCFLRSPTSESPSSDADSDHTSSMISIQTQKKDVPLNSRGPFEVAIGHSYGDLLTVSKFTLPLSTACWMDRSTPLRVDLPLLISTKVMLSTSRLSASPLNDM